MSRTFHFTIGPVQDFVAQARRTRDFWAGSFILSWLSAVAMRAAEKQGGEIIFPKPDADFMAALEGEVGESGDKPQQGTVPNRFMADVPDGFETSRVAETVWAAWRALADQVWQGDRLSDVGGDLTRAIWDRQIDGLWEITWAVTENRDASVLDRRKNWRSHRPPEEPGPKCHIMAGWQELSGADRPGTGPAAFWNRLRAEVPAESIRTDVRDGEQLCALAYIKRRLTRHFQSIDAEMPGGWRLKGWSLPSGVPSVAYMAAAHWLAGTIRQADPNALWGFHDAAFKLTGSYGEWDTNIHCIREAVKDVGGHRKWESLDGDVLFEEFLDNPRAFPDSAKAEEVRKALVRLKNNAGTGDPTPFYALVLMDGDSLGVHMADPAKQDAITRGLADFTEAVPSTVRNHNGFPIYAGGDDVLALLPLEDALPCAAELRRRYLEAFQDTDIPTTLSGAVVFAHVRTPLTQVNARAHTLLDDIAKAETGRDALAVQVRKPSGVAATWSQPWEIALDRDANDVALQSLANQLGEKTGDAPFASRFFYHLRERYALLNGDGDGSGSFPFDASNAEQLLAAEYRNAALASGQSPPSLRQARAIVAPLLNQCRPGIREAESADETKSHSVSQAENSETEQSRLTRQPRLVPDGALIVRFLAQKGAQA